jgi:transcriptional regulator with XRE-family HTH domain
MNNRLRALREKAGMTRQDLADRIGTSLSQIVKLERGERRLTQDWMERAATALGVHAADLLVSRTVPLIGKEGAGAVVLWADHDGDLNLGEVDAPPDATETTAALEVEGDSMPGVADPGSVLYYDERHDPPHESMVGKLCVAWCEDGRVLVKRLGFGSSPGLWSLVSVGGAVERDVALQYAAKVLWIRPA